MPVEDVFSITGRGTVVTGRIEQGDRAHGRRGRDRRDPGDDEDDGDGRGDVPEAAGRGPGGRQRGLPACAARRRKRWSAGQVLAKPGSITPHTKFKAQAYILTKDEGGRHTPFFNGLPAAVLLPDDGRDGRREPSGRDGDGDAGRQRRDDGGADHADRDGQGAALRDPRRRPHRRRRRRGIEIIE